MTQATGNRELVTLDGVRYRIVRRYRRYHDAYAAAGKLRGGRYANLPRLGWVVMIPAETATAGGEA